jgi:hypothetical protein
MPTHAHLALAATFLAFTPLAFTAALTREAAAQSPPSSPPSSPSSISPSPADTMMARDQFHAGMEAARAGSWEAARQAFERSFQLAPRPITLLNLAGAQLQSQRYVAAAESYRRFLREGTSGPALEQREAAKQELARAEGHIAHVQLTVRGLQPGDRFLLDGDTVPAAAVSGLEIPMDPGDHAIAIARDGGELSRQTVHVEDHETRALAINVPPPLAPATSGPAAHEGAATPTAASALTWKPPAEPPAPAGRSHGVFASPWFWTAVGVVAAGGATAIVLVSRTPGSTAGPYAGNVPPGSLVVP